MAGLVVTGRRRVVREEVRPGRGGGMVVRQGGGHCRVVAGQLRGQPVVLTQGGVVAGRLRHTDQLLLSVGVRVLVLAVI